MRTFTGWFKSILFLIHALTGVKGEASRDIFQEMPNLWRRDGNERSREITPGGSHTASITVTAEICLHCGERLYNEKTVRRFEEIRHKLEHQQTSAFQPMGQSFRVE